ncbi:MAG: glycosyltransferase family 39 protein [Terriglobales bacterium]
MPTTIAPEPVTQASCGTSTTARTGVESRGGSVAFWMVLLAVTAAGAAYAYVHLKNGWIAGDDGFLAQCALRVFRGELPHRDFHDNYTGGLSMYHALWFHIFGVNLVAMRYAVFVVMVPWIAAVYYIATRFAAAFAAGAVTLLAIAWSLPTYPAAMPSWYNLFFATFAAAALLRFVDVGTRRWLLVAGVCAGVSCTVKIIGVYSVAAILLFFIFREQSEAASRTESGGQSSTAYRGFVVSGLVLFLALLLWMMHRQLGSGELYHFFLPAAAMVALLLWREARILGAGSRERFMALLRMALPFALGFALPVGLFLAPYVLSHSVGALLTGASGGVENVMSSPRRPVIPEDGLFYVWPLYALMAVALKRERAWGTTLNVIIAAGLAAILFFMRPKIMVAFVAWRSALMIGPVVVLLAVWFFARRKDFASLLTKKAEQGTFLLAALAGLCSLVQFPVAFPVYVCYFAPLTALTLFAVVSVSDRCRCKPFFAQLLIFYLAFAVFFVSVRAMYLNAFSYEPKLRAFHLPRAQGLRAHDADYVEDAVAAILAHAQDGPMLAAPEGAELYFLTDLRNPTDDDRRVTPQALERAIQDPNLKVMVVKHAFHFPASKLTPEELSEIAARFPNWTNIGVYEIHWRP